MARLGYFRSRLNVECLPVDSVLHNHINHYEVINHHIFLLQRWWASFTLSMSRRYYDVDSATVDWTSMVYMITYIPLIFPGAWIMERMVMPIQHFNPFRSIIRSFKGPSMDGPVWSVWHVTRRLDQSLWRSTGSFLHCSGGSNHHCHVSSLHPGSSSECGRRLVRSRAGELIQELKTLTISRKFPVFFKVSSACSIGVFGNQVCKIKMKLNLK